MTLEAQEGGGTYDALLEALKEIVSDMAADDAAGTLNWGHAKDALETARAAIQLAEGR